MKRNSKLTIHAIRPAAFLVLAIFAVGAGHAQGVTAGQEQPGPRLDPSTFPVTIRIDTTKTTGEMRPVWRLFRLRRAELHLHEGRSEAARTVEGPQSPTRSSSAPTTC